jgi:hypothetical protein
MDKQKEKYYTAHYDQTMLAISKSKVDLNDYLENFHKFNPKELTLAVAMLTPESLMECNEFYVNTKKDKWVTGIDNKLAMIIIDDYYNGLIDCVKELSNYSIDIGNIDPKDAMDLRDVSKIVKKYLYTSDMDFSNKKDEVKDQHEKTKILFKAVKKEAYKEVFNYSLTEFVSRVRAFKEEKELNARYKFLISDDEE